ncbi:MAG: phage holin family protein [Candidatus Sungbacteria bacterium]|nr:phage holin family protein [Candidatus Sungbacteria bacterium]
MHFLARIFGKLLVNAVLLYGASTYFSGLTITGGAISFLIAALVITLLNIFVKPVFRFITAPLVWLTLGLFLIVINVVILWIADILLPSIEFADYYSLVILSIIIGIANSLL